MIRKEAGDGLTWRSQKVLVMLCLGFASGLPFLLTGNTLGYWLRETGSGLGLIGILSWVGLAYSLKILWAPALDSIPVPLLHRFGQRRGWILLSQLWIAVGLTAIAVVGADHGLGLMGGLALLVALGSATQDIAVDAWRIEGAESAGDMGILSSAHQFGYRVALLATDALILVFAEAFGWQLSYGICAMSMAIGVIAILVVPEPGVRSGVLAKPINSQPTESRLGLVRAIIDPFSNFFRSHGWLSLLILAVIGIYRLPDFLMGPMYNPFYHDLGLTKDVVGTIRGSIGLVFSLIGILVAGASVKRFGYVKCLMVGALLQGIAVGAFALLTRTGPDPIFFGAIMGFDGFAISFAGVALVAYMSSLTGSGYTATQYALLSSAYAYPGKILKGFSGLAVESLALQLGLLPAYAIAFLGAGMIALPTLVLCLWLAHATYSASIQSRRQI